MYRTKVNKNSEFSFSEDGDNSIKSQFDEIITKVTDRSFLVEDETKGLKSFADIEEINVETKKVVVKMNQNRYEIDIKEPVDLKLEKLGIKVVSQRKLKSLVAPMPGLVLKVLVSEGQEVKQGEPLMILEAMKMENVFKSASDVTISKICVEEKTPVEKGQELIIFE